MTRLALLLGILAAYAAVLGRGPAARAFGGRGFDVMSPQAAAVEQFIAAGRFDEALPIAKSLRAKYPDEPQVAYWIATVQQRLGHYAEAAEAWSEYVQTSAAPGDACPWWPEAYVASSQPDRARTAVAKCDEWTRR